MRRPPPRDTRHRLAAGAGGAGWPLSGESPARVVLDTGTSWEIPGGIVLSKGDFDAARVPDSVPLVA